MIKTDGILDIDCGFIWWGNYSGWIYVFQVKEKKILFKKKLIGPISTRLCLVILFFFFSIFSHHEMGRRVNDFH